MSGAPKLRRGEKEEYKALRDEILALFNRSFVILGAVVTTSGVIIWRCLDFVTMSHRPQAHMLAFFLAIVVAAAMAVTYKFYDHAYRIGAYIEVFHEGEDQPGWHNRNRRIRAFVRQRGSAVRRSVANLLEPRVLAYLYLPFAILAAALMLVTPVTEIRAWNVISPLLPLGVATYFFAELGFFFDRRYDWWLYWWREFGAFEESAARHSSSESPTNSSMVDPATTLVALLLLEAFVLWALGFVTKPPALDATLK